MCIFINLKMFYIKLKNKKNCKENKIKRFEKD